mgnify:CR=1 FL=1
MRILACCPYGYYGGRAASYEYLSFVEIPRRLGHTVQHFDYAAAAAANREAMNEFFLHAAKTGGYDLVFVMTLGEEFLPQTLDEARRYVPTLAWNCDDDYRWDEYSRHYAPHYTFMVTTYRHVYEANRAAHPNLRLSQWGCTGFDDGLATAKDIAFSFVGGGHGVRLYQIERLRRLAGLQAFGKAVPPPRSTLQRWCRALAQRLPGVTLAAESTELPDQAAVKALWNRSKISFTPLDATRGAVTQIKARVFDMGLSGTVMLCTHNPLLHEFYEPGQEYVEFNRVDDCAEKVRWLLQHDAERRAIAERYYRRTRSEHLWEHRFRRLFGELGLSRSG